MNAKYSHLLSCACIGAIHFLSSSSSSLSRSSLPSFFFFLPFPLFSFLYHFIDTIIQTEILVLFFQLYHILSMPLTRLLTTVFLPRGVGNGRFFFHDRHQRTHLVQNIYECQEEIKHKNLCTDQVYR